MSVNIVSASAQDDALGLNVLVYGKHGCGKTYLACTAADDERSNPVLLIDVEGGSRTAIGFENLDIVKPDTWDEITAVRDHLTEGNHEYKTVILDSLTETQSLLLDQLAQTNKSGVPELREYSIATTRIISLVRRLRIMSQRQGITVVFTAGLREDENKSTGVRTLMPAMTPETSRSVVGAVDSVWLLESKGEGGRSLTLNERPRVVAKTRTPRVVSELPGNVDNPSISSLLDIVNGKAKG